MLREQRERRKGLKLGHMTGRNNRLRAVYLFSVIDEDSAQDVIEELLELDTDRKKRPITLYISCPGGYCSYAMGIIDVIEKLRCPTKAIALGDVSSMAPLIFVACDERVISKHAFIMLHPIAGGSQDYMQFVKSRLKNMEAVEKQYEKYFLSKTTLPKKLYAKSRSAELWLTAEEAIKYGIAHKIM